MTENNITPRQAKELLESNEGYVYLDVRTEEEFEAGHAPGAVNIPLARMNAMGEMELNPDFLAVVRANLRPDAKLIVGCRSGGRSARACEVLAGNGYPNALNLQGGFVGVPGPGGVMVEPGWAALGFPVEAGTGGERSYCSLLRR